MLMLWQGLFYMTGMRGDARPASLSQSENQADNRVDDGDESMASEKDDAGPANAKTAGSRQNERLYTEEGMLNTKLKKAGKKRRKKGNKVHAMEDDLNDDYHFNVDYVKEGSAMDIGPEVGQDADNQNNRFQLPSGV
ncbi:hypothetical protein ACH5RR_010451 [Cinchona calisaya]|uniref:Uncharacterized protein n=1 Tax=Cinchona calisaya TaxID=153742 RepID=A0ABD3AJ00_9GENT